ncbi:MAG: PKD domain-containing protein [Candidatus Thiodiazotropha lotti]|nr:PKD domain-containing protein [Candidatus Thiodiazotropha lotti]MCG7999766.1 PKD domain-containing protein [Candidatus Thiodiazotropha lotti]MCW4182043.1 PKD domain-containing protein [Candidatus Thiodiazotropha weberae]MCW4191535.1 PKD domain-containing protein [Candidatus Thiodiazotropha weberae]
MTRYPIITLIIACLAFYSLPMEVSADTIYACVQKQKQKQKYNDDEHEHEDKHKKAGRLRIVSAPGQCRKKEYELSWSDGGNIESRVNQLIGRVEALERALGIMNEPPTVDAGGDQTILLSMQALFNATATDDGLLNPLTYNWDIISGPGNVTFSNDIDTTTSASFSQAGNYVLQLSVSDGLVTVTDQVNVIVYPDNTPPVIFVNSPQIVGARRYQTGRPWTLECSAVNLDVSVTDDGLPLPVTYDWTIDSINTGQLWLRQYNIIDAQFDAQPSDSVNWPLTITARHDEARPNYYWTTTYLARNVIVDLTLTASDGYHMVQSNHSVECSAGANEPPVVEAGVNQVLTGYNTQYGYACDISLSATASDDGLPEPLEVGWNRHQVIPSLNGTWLLNVIFSNSAALTTSVSIQVEPIPNRSYPIPDSITQTIGFSATDGWYTESDTLDITCQRPSQ